MSTPASTRIALVHTPGQPVKGVGQNCSRCGLELLGPEALSVAPTAYWPVENLVVEYRPGFDGSAYSYRQQNAPPYGSYECDQPHPPLPTPGEEP